MNKKDTFREWQRLLEEGYTSDVIINGLIREVESRKNASTFRGGNNLRFMKSPINYLKGRSFLDFEEEVEKQEEEDDTNYA